MTIEVCDLFAGAGGSATGAAGVPGVEVTMAANHWPTAVDVHQAAFPDARHDCADLSGVDFRRYPAADILLASPECTSHTASKGVSRRRQSVGLFDDPDPGAERSRATMWDVHRYVEVHRPAAVVVENVVEAHAWLYWPSWWQAFADAGYDAQVVSLNSMHAGVPQSRDRIYVVAMRRGVKADLSLRPEAWCPGCEQVVAARQAWKNGRRVGRYRRQYLYRCPTCAGVVEPATSPASSIIDWGLPSLRIGDRRRPLAEATLRRIRLGLERYGVAVVAGAGNTWERPGSGYARAWPVSDPLPTQTTTNGHGLALPGLIAELRGGGSRDKLRPVSDPLATVEAGANHHALVCPPLVVQPAHGGDDATRVRGVERPLPTVCASDDRPLTVEPPAITVGDHHDLLVAYNSTGRAQPVSRPAPTLTTKDRLALVVPQLDIEDCTFRMFEPHEVGAAMAFAPGYAGETMAALTKRDRVRLYGNAVTPPAMTFIVGRVVDALVAA
ncbi:MAG: DNA cytosine methyltransferase [Acidimicrobiales bacterium]